MYPAFVLLLADMSCLLFLFRKYCFFLPLFSSSFPPCVLFSFFPSHTLMALTVVIHSFVADSSLLDCCYLVFFVLLWCFLFCFVFLVVFSTLCLQVGHRLGFGGGFSSCFSFGVSCLHDWLRQPLIFRLPPAFVVWSFLATDICVQSLSFTTFPAIGSRVRLLSLPC